MRSVGSVGSDVDEELVEGLDVLDSGACSKLSGLKSNNILDSLYSSYHQNGETKLKVK